MDDEEDITFVGTGSVGPTSLEESQEYPLAMLWLPDPETRRGWALKRIDRVQDQPRRRMGYQW